MPTVPVTLRLTREQLKTAERLASRSGVRYQTVLKKLITDGLSSWERAGRLKNWC
jgi:predicted DNA binding CopG/RHH family protein